MTRSSAIACVYLRELAIGAAHDERIVVGRLLAHTPRIASAGRARYWAEPVPRAGAIDGWCKDVAGALADLGSLSVGVGPTATVAWAAARSTPHGARVISEDEAVAFLGACPVDVLELDREAVAVLAGLGVRRVGDLLALPASALQERLGPDVTRARRRASGDDPRRPFTVRLWREPTVSVDLEDAIDGLEPLLFVLRPATEALARELSAAGLGATCTAIDLRHDTRSVTSISVRSESAIARATTLFELARTRLERAELPSEVTGVTLTARETARLTGASADLFMPLPRGVGSAHRDEGAAEVALERLRTRFGDGAVRRAERVELASPLSRAVWNASLCAGSPVASAEGTDTASPFRRLSPPAAIERGSAFVAGRRRRVVKIGRVERTTAPWWNDGTCRVELLAWAELDGSLLCVLRARVSSNCEDAWEVVAWLD